VSRKLKNELDRADLTRLPVHPGLCATCLHRRLLRSRRSVFLRCGLAETDERFLRYPPLPVMRCGGYRESR
jgi:hypothetical protein